MVKKKKDPRLVALGRNIARMREAKGMTQIDLIADAKISSRTLYLLEGGLSDPKFLTLTKIADCLGVEVIDLISGKK